ncbi:MAG: hypothetical protein R3F48_15385 [Candidatus Zixiibacteriota bacterium]
MYPLHIKLNDYLCEILAIRVHIQKWEVADSLPYYLQDEFSFFSCELLNIKCLLAFSRDDTKQTPAQIKKYFQTLGNYWAGEIVYVRNKITAFERKRLIEQKVSFIVPHNQMYLPIFGIELREYFHQIKNKRSKFRPSTQAIIVSFLLSRIQFEFSIQEIAGKTGYTKMAISRAFDELQASGLAEVAQKGRERVIRFGEDKRAIWNQSLDYTRNPIKKRILTDSEIDRTNTVISGMSALSHYSMIAPNQYETIAISGKAWKLIEQDFRITIVPIPDVARYEIEIWHYDPTLFASHGIVDQLSLYLCLRNNEDERVQLSLDEMMRHIEW